ncbi:MAG: efflux RND transporter permease subunit [Selenomonadales bacterium]|nr:efflux RND transporter permease subunit [Selenomonadales bacterium]
MSLPAFATSRRITVLMLVLITVVIGVMSYTRTPVDLLPNMNFPMAAVLVSFPGAAPQEVETLVTRPLEGTLATVSNIREVSSTSSAGQATILLSFNWGTNMDFAALEMREKIDLMRRLLPAEVGAPTVMKFDPSLMPIMAVDFGSDTRTGAELRDLADRVLASRLERVAGVASVSVSGGQQTGIEVRLDPAKLEAMGITLAQVTGALRTASLNLPGGTLSVEGQEYLIRSVGQLTSLSEIEDLIVGMRTIRTVRTVPAATALTMPQLPPGLVIPGLPATPSPTPQQQVTTTTEPVYLRQVGTVAEVNVLGNTVTLLNRLPSVSIRLHKQSDANTVLVANLVHAELEQLRADFADLTIVPTQDQSRFIEAAISAVGQNAAYGGLLAVLVLLVFLKSVAPTLVIAIAVPVSVVATFALVYFGNLTINMMTLMGLALGIGMLVDNSIVVLENIYRYQEEGADRLTAARKGTEEVAMAITASTLTTVAVFLPVAFVGGITGMMFRELALTVSFSLLSSLAVALIVVPVLSATILRTRPSRAATGQRRLNQYQASLKWALGHKAVVALLTLALLGGSLLTFGRIGGEFIPTMDQGELSVTVTLPAGSAVSETQEVATVVLDDLLARPEVGSVSTSIGGAGGGRMMGMAAGRANRATMTVVLKTGYRSADIAAEINAKYADFADGTVRASAAAGMGGGGGMGLGGSTSVVVNLSGPTLAGLRQYADQIKEAAATIEGITEVRDNAGVGANELVVRVDREKAARLGLAPTAIAGAVRTAFQGENVSRVSRDGREIDVNVSLIDSARQSIADLENLIVAAREGQVVRLSQVASVEQAVGPASINRRANQRYVAITATVEGRDLRSVTRDLQERLDALELPVDYRAELAGDALEMNEAFSGLITALILAVVLVYMVMASQFESLLYPFIVMFTMPLAVIGVLLALFFTGQTFNVPSIMGVIVLAGIVVNNAIVLVDYINQLRARGRSVHDAIIEAAGARLRPILMTTTTTILALVPMAVLGGSAAEMQRPLSIAIIGGLTMSTLLTLYIIPLAYDLATLRE